MISAKEKKAIYDKAIKKYGWDNSLRKLVEELSECLVAIAHLPEKTTLEDVAGECADVLIVVESLCRDREFRQLLDNKYNEKLQRFSEVLNGSVH